MNWSRGGSGPLGPTPWTRACKGTPANVRINVIPHRHSHFHCGLQNTYLFWNVVHNGRQGHQMLLILAPIKSACATSYWSSIVILVLSCPGSEILHVFCPEQRPYPIHPNFGGITLGLDCLCCGSYRSEDPIPKVITPAITIRTITTCTTTTYMLTIPQRYRQTDRRTYLDLDLDS